MQDVFERADAAMYAEKTLLKSLGAVTRESEDDAAQREAELDCLKIGAMDFIPKPYPDIEIMKARIAICIELSENRDLIRSTQRTPRTA